MAKKYDASSISIMEYPLNIQENLPMYIGECDWQGLRHLAKEIIGNSLDEASNGHGDWIQVSLEKSGRVTVADQGRGIPIGPHPEQKGKDTLLIIATTTHSGGKFKTGEDSGYDAAIGTHGLGLAVVNAASTVMEIWTFRDKAWHYLSFKGGIADFEKPVKKNPPKDLLIEHENKGTIIRYTPNLSLFDKGTKLNPDQIASWFEDLSYFTDGVTFTLHVEGKEPVDYYRENGLQDWYDHVVADMGEEPLADPMIIRSPNVDIMFGWTSGTTEEITTAVSTFRTIDGGTHANAFNAAISEGFSYYVKRGQEYDNKFLRAGLVAVVNIKMQRPKFASQNKSKLVSPEAKDYVMDAMVHDEVNGGWLYEWIESNKKAAEQVIERAVSLTMLMSKHKADAALAAAVKVEAKGKVNLPTELVVSTTDDPSIRELFVTEGLSAGGSLVAARNRIFQEVLPLSGKISNVFKQGEKAYANPKVISLLKSIGYKPGSEEYRVNKIILLSDSDDDGFHINALLLAFFQHTTPELIEQGKVFVVDSNLYLYRTDKGEMVFAPNYKSLEKKVKTEFPKLRFNTDKVTRIKGWGEVDADVLEQVATDPEKRQLIKVTVDEAKKAYKRVIDLMGESVEARRILLGID